MAVQEQTPYVTYTGNGVTTAFAYPFKVLMAQDLAVSFNDVLQPSGLYTIAGLGNDAGGTVTFFAPPGSGVAIVIASDVVNERTTDYIENGDLLANTLDDDIDRLWLAQESTRSLIGGAIRVPYPEQVQVLPPASQRVDRLLAFDPVTGKPELSDFTQTQVSSAIAAAYSGAAGPLDALSFIQAGTGAVPRSAQAKARERFSPDDFGAVGNGVADDTAAFNLAFAAVGDGGSITLTQGKVYKVTSVPVTGKRVTLVGFGAVIQCSGHANGSIYKTDHDKKLTVVGVKFTGAGRAINYVTTTSGSQFDDFEALMCRFENTDYGIYLDGPRESRIVMCSFEGASNNGIYRTRSVNTDVVACYWKNTVYGVNDDGDGSPFSAGLKVIGGTMIGCGHGVLSQRVDFCLINGVMIDYCDNPVVFRGVDIGHIVGGCYITTRTTAPAILAGEHAGSATVCREIRILGCSISSNTDDVTSDCVRLEKVASGEVSSNSITFWWRTGVDISNCTNVRVSKNKINADPGSTAPTKTSVLESAGGNSSNVISENEVSHQITTINAEIGRNTGYVTQNRGEGAAGSGVTSFTVAHALSYTPSKSDVILTPTNLEAASKNPFVSAVDATNITIGFTAATAASAGVGWTVKRGGTRV